MAAIAMSDLVNNQSEACRLQAVDRLEILDSPHEPAFDRIVALVRKIFGVETALVTILDAHRQWQKAQSGFELTEVPRRLALCNTVIETARPLILPDVALDARFVDNPFVATGSVGFYAGHPLVTADGEVIGSLCAIDSAPRAWSERDDAILADLAAVTMEAVQLRRLATIDGLTGVLTRRAFAQEADKALYDARGHDEPLSVIVFDLDRFKSVNDRFGHAVGDRVLGQAVASCNSILRKSDVIGRLGGEEFAVLLPETSSDAALAIAERLRHAIASAPVDAGGTRLDVTASFGVSTAEGDIGSVDGLIAAADKAMYVSKSAGRNRCTRMAPFQDRRRVLMAGRIRSDRDSAPVDCTIRTLGSQGARLEIAAESHLPARFDLMIGTDPKPRQCEIAARAGRHVEVNFR